MIIQGGMLKGFCTQTLWLHMNTYLSGMKI